jgi:hypothetical protein
MRSVQRFQVAQLTIKTVRAVHVRLVLGWMATVVLLAELIANLALVQVAELVILVSGTMVELVLHVGRTVPLAQVPAVALVKQDFGMMEGLAWPVELIATPVALLVLLVTLVKQVLNRLPQSIELASNVQQIVNSVVMMELVQRARLDSSKITEVVSPAAYPTANHAPALAYVGFVIPGIESTMMLVLLVMFQIAFHALMKENVKVAVLGISHLKIPVIR